MPAQLGPRHPDRVIARLADRQHGVASRQQLLDAGLTVDAVRERVRSRHLIPIHRGVYAVGHKRLRIEGVWIAAVLACGPGAVLSHRDAAALWDLLPAVRAAVHVTVGRPGRGKRQGLVLHPSELPTDHVSTRNGIPVPSPSRTLADLASTATRAQL